MSEEEKSLLDRRIEENQTNYNAIEQNDPSNLNLEDNSNIEYNLIVTPVSVHACENYEQDHRKEESIDMKYDDGWNHNNLNLEKSMSDSSIVCQNDFMAIDSCTSWPDESDPRECKSDTDMLEESRFDFSYGEDKSDTIVDVPSKTPLAYRPRRKRLLRSKSWSARTRHDSINARDLRLIRERLLRTQSRLQPSAIRNFTRQQIMTLISLAIIDFMSFCSMSIMAPFFPKEANEKGLTDSVSGFVFSFYALIMFITSPIFGKILPNVGAKFMLISGMFVAGFCNLLFGVLEYIVDYTTFTTYCFVLRGLEAVGASAYSTASYVYVVNTFPNNIGSVLGILETFIGLGMSVGPAIGGLLYSVGGFGLPFYVLGIAMVSTIPINFCLLPSQNDYVVSQKSGSLLELIKAPTVVITSLVIIVVSNIWAFLDPTLEPHLRQFDLDAKQVGLIFLLFSALYGLSSPLWGWLADRINNHWLMMVWGMLFCSIGLLLLGPSPLLPFLKSSLWLNLVGLSIVGISVALTLLPTFQGVLTSSIEEGGCSENITTYSMVAGVWSCMYSLGEVLGPSLGGVLLKNYGFPICSTVMASFTFAMTIITFLFFSLRSNNTDSSESSSNDSTDRGWISSSARQEMFGQDLEEDDDEQDPLVGHPRGNSNVHRQSYGGTGVSTNEIVGFRPKRQNVDLQDNKVDNARVVPVIKITDCSENLENFDENHNMSDERLKDLIQSDMYQQYLDKSLDAVKNMENNFSKRTNSYCDENWDSTTEDFINYSKDKVRYYKQSRRSERDGDLGCFNDITDVRGTVDLTFSGACEV